jgi:hypothetical protein
MCAWSFGGCIPLLSVIVWAIETVVAMLQVMRSIKAGMYIVMLIDLRWVFGVWKSSWHIRRRLPISLDRVVLT